jgi:hypothetical protein
MADVVSALNAEKFEKVQSLLQSLKDDARKANDEGDLYMLAVYNDLLQVCSPIVVTALARMEREEKAELNKREKAMRKQAREEREAQKQNA